MKVCHQSYQQVYSSCTPVQRSQLLEGSDDRRQKVGRPLPGNQPETTLALSATAPQDQRATRHTHRPEQRPFSGGRGLSVARRAGGGARAAPTRRGGQGLTTPDLVVAEGSHDEPSRPFRRHTPNHDTILDRSPFSLPSLTLQPQSAGPSPPSPPPHLTFPLTHPSPQLTMFTSPLALLSTLALVAGAACAKNITVTVSPPDI